MSKKKKHQEEVTPVVEKDDDWLSTKVDLNDGWADDVPLIYPEGGWKPDDAELIQVEIEQPLSEKEKKKKRKAAAKQQKLDEMIENDNVVKKESKINGYRLFLIIWLGLLSIAIALGLDFFYNFLEHYEEVYQSSRPFHKMDEIIVPFQDMDTDVIYNLMTLKPEINEFESDDNLTNYMYELIADKYIDYRPTANYNDDFPEYYITADDYIIATVELRKDPTNILEHNFPTWYVSNLEFFTDAQFSARVEIPDNYTLFVNGKEVSDEYRYEKNIQLDGADVFEEYTTVPTLEKFYCDSFYEKPTVTAFNDLGEETDVVWNTDRGIYEVPFSEDPESSEIQEYCIQASCDYANWTSQDAPANIIDKYFPAGSELLKMIKSGTSRQYFTSHHGTNIDNIVVEEYMRYNDEAVHCKVTLDQNMIIYGKDTVVPVHCDFYYHKEDDVWKIVAIKY